MDASARALLIEDNRLDLRRFSEIAERPPLFEPGEPLFWDDPHISEEMLKTHLDPLTDAASRRPETIERTVTSLVSRLGLQPGDSLLDLGCGPGLYATRFAQRGLSVTGVDYSRRSIEFAQRSARELEPPVQFIYRDYLDIDYSQQFDAAVLIYGDFCTFAPGPAGKLLERIHAALRPGGYFAFDVMTPAHSDRSDSQKEWSAEEAGFWRPGPHLVLEQTLDYPEYEHSTVYLKRYLVLDEDGELADYRLWYQLYTAATIGPLLEKAGFALVEAWADLEGTPCPDNSEWLGLLARRT